jgi:Mor family transcriptional regulator
MSDDGDLFGLPDDLEERRKLLDQAAHLPEDRWAPQLAELLAFVEALFKRRRMTPEAAFELACEVVIELAQAFGGRNMYLPRGDRLQVALRDAALWRRYSGRPEQVEQFADELGVTTIHVYALLAKQRKLHVGRLQGSLPFPAPPA